MLTFALGITALLMGFAPAKGASAASFPLPGGLLAPERLALLWLVQRRAALHPALAPRRQRQTDL